MYHLLAFVQQKKYERVQKNKILYYNYKISYIKNNPLQQSMVYITTLISNVDLMMTPRSVN